MGSEPIELGRKVKDSVTGIEGVATARAVYLHGVVTVRVEWAHDGLARDDWFAETRLSYVEAAAA
jgi:hypothetical protein